MSHVALFALLALLDAGGSWKTMAMEVCHVFGCDGPSDQGIDFYHLLERFNDGNLGTDIASIFPITGYDAPKWKSFSLGVDMFSDIEGKLKPVASIAPIFENIKFKDIYHYEPLDGDSKPTLDLQPITRCLFGKNVTTDVLIMVLTQLEHLGNNCEVTHQIRVETLLRLFMFDGQVLTQHAFRYIQSNVLAWLDISIETGSVTIGDADHLRGVERLHVHAKQNTTGFAWGGDDVLQRSTMHELFVVRRCDPTDLCRFELPVLPASVKNFSTEGASFTEIPRQFGKNPGLKEFRIKGNKAITIIADNSGLQDMKLEYFSIVACEALTHIDDNALQHPPIHIEISETGLTRIPRFIERFHDTHIVLHNNSLDCNCDMEWIRNGWHTRRSSRAQLELGECYSPPELKGYKIWDIMTNDKIRLCKQPDVVTTERPSKQVLSGMSSENYGVIFLICFTAVLLAGALLLACVLLWYRLGTHLPHCPGKIFHLRRARRAEDETELVDMELVPQSML